MQSKHVLIQDDDGHWYICPADKKESASAILMSIARYWLEGQYDAPPPAMPDYLVEVRGSPSLVKFREFRIG